jgi:subtilisin family serine protease
MRDVRGLGGILLAVALAACQPQPGGVTARLTLGWEDLAGTPPAQADVAAVERRFSLQALAASDGVIAVLKPGVAAPAGARRIGERTWALRAASASEAKAWLARLERHPGVELAEPDVQVQATSWPPNDPLHPQQWSLSAIQVPALWALTRGKEAPLVAVIDSGVDATHPDLAGRVVKGRDFIDQDDEPNDPLGHGTFVAGVVAAAANNGQGMAGIAPEAKVLAVRVLDDTGRGRGSSVIEGVRYAASAGAKVLNLSLGSFYPSSAMRVAIA